MLTNANRYAMIYLVVGICQRMEVRRIKTRGTIMFYDLYLRIFEKGYNIESFAEKMGFSTRTLYAKLQGKSDWKSSEMMKAAQLLGCTKQINKYFF